jgi:23S rRNA (pseudouridine1915-N3)-methyltransferase
MNIQIILIKKQLKPFYQECIDEYKKRLGRFCKINIVFCKSLDDVKKTYCTSNYNIGIKEEMNSISSENLSEKISLYQMSSYKDICIFINIDELVFDESFGITSIAMDNELVAVIVFEQIYRAYKIIHKEAYHK